MVDRHGPGQVDDAAFGRVVGGKAHIGGKSRNRSRVDDVASALNQVRQGRAAGVKDRAQGGSDHPVPYLGRDLGDIAKRTHASIVDQHIEAAKAGHGVGNKPFDLSRLGNVDTPQMQPRFRKTERLALLLERIEVDVA